MSDFETINPTTGEAIQQYSHMSEESQLADTLTCDVAVIGAGTAGLSAARAAREVGARTLLIDPAFSGTVCATAGCMPSKLLIAAGRRAEAVRSANVFGLATAPPGVDGRAVMARLRRVRDSFVDGVLDTFASLPDVTLVKARTRLTVRLYAEPKMGRLTGAVLACPGAEHLAHLIAWSIQRGETASGLLSFPFYHPTLEEGLKGALRAICAAVPDGLPQDRDHGNPPGA